MSTSDVSLQNTCCFAGYRPHKFNFNFVKGNNEYEQLKKDVYDAILKSYGKGYRNFLCGGAMGFDIFCGEITLKAKELFPDIKLICVLPYESYANKFPRPWFERYLNILDKCDSITYISPKYISGCYYARSEKMVDDSSLVITYFDGKGGGTDRTIAYAQLNKRTILNLCKQVPVTNQLTFFTGRKK